MLPVVGGFLHLGFWPAIMGVTMWVQMKLNPAPPDPTQQMIFNWMPIIFTFMLAKFPAGLVIYWAWNNSLSVSAAERDHAQARRQDSALGQSQGHVRQAEAEAQAAGGVDSALTCPLNSSWPGLVPANPRLETLAEDRKTSDGCDSAG